MFCSEPDVGLIKLAQRSSFSSLTVRLIRIHVKGRVSREFHKLNHCDSVLNRCAKVRKYNRVDSHDVHLGRASIVLAKDRNNVHEICLTHVTYTLSELWTVCTTRVRKTLKGTVAQRSRTLRSAYLCRCFSTQCNEQTCRQL